MKVRFKQNQRLGNQRGAAMMEFAVLAAVLLGVIIPGMISVGKSLSELNAAAQGAYLAAQDGAQVKIDVGEKPTGEAELAAYEGRLSDLNAIVKGRVEARLNSVYPLIASNLEGNATLNTGADEVNDSDSTLLRTPDTEHWLVQTDMTAHFPAIFTDIPVRVKSVSSMLNVKPEVAGNLSSPQRLRVAGGLPQYDCKPKLKDVLCTVGDEFCASDCCNGESSGDTAILTAADSGRPGWHCTGASFGLGGDSDDGGDTNTE